MNHCIFCKIIAGEIPAATVYEDDHFKAILDISPAAKGHVILLPKKHAENLYDLDDETMSLALKAAQEIAIALKEELGCDGINMLQNNGEAAGQTVFHYHIHLIPRYKNDRVTFTWSQGTYEDGEAVNLAGRILKRVKL